MAVYFMRRKDGVGPIKIGTATDVKRRFDSINAMVPDEVVILATIQGNVYDEGRIHGVFAHARHRGEWFRPTAGVMALVDHCRSLPDGERIAYPTLRRYADLDGAAPASAWDRMLLAADGSGVDTSSRGLARATGLAANTLGRAVLRGRTDITGRRSVALAALFGVNERWMATGEGPMRGE